MPQDVTYRPAPRSFLRVCRFAAFIRSIELAKQPPAEEEPQPAPRLRPVTAEEQAGLTGEPGHQEGLTVIDLLDAVLVRELGPDLAPVIVQAVEPDGSVRDVTVAEARSDAFDSDTFALAFTLFLGKASVLTHGLSGIAVSTG